MPCKRRWISRTAFGFVAVRREFRRPRGPATIEETGLGEEFVEQLICKYLAVFGTNKGRSIADHICLPFNVIEPLLGTLRTNQIVVHAGAAPFNDYYYSLTAQGRTRAHVVPGSLRLRRARPGAADATM